MDGDKPVKIAKAHSDATIIHALINDPFLELPIGVSKKVINTKIKPTCKPETDKT